MLIQALIAAGLVVVTVVIHAAGFSALLRAIMRSRSLRRFGFWPTTQLLIVVTCWLILVHLIEICVWGSFYFWQGCLPDAETAIYFSAGTYTSVGFGDIVLAPPWRILGPLETLTGILMTGLSTGVFFAIVNQRIRNWMQTYPAAKHGAGPIYE